jgi:hypothetical protein
MPDLFTHFGEPTMSFISKDWEEENLYILEKA